MAIFSIEGSGLIQTGSLPSGDMTVSHTGGGLVFDIVNASCGNGRGYWNAQYRNWVVFKRFSEQVLASSGSKGSASSNGDEISGVAVDSFRLLLNYPGAESDAGDERMATIWWLKSDMARAQPVCCGERC